jgi:hypothetical protein
MPRRRVSKKAFSLPPSPTNTTYTQHTQSEVEKYQRHMLNGYATRELMDLDAFSNRELTPSTLQNVINQIMLRDRWSLRDWPPITITGGDPNLIYGDWSAGNDLVWNVMESRLQLASRIFSHFHTHPWVCESCRNTESGVMLMTTV